MVVFKDSSARIGKPKAVVKDKAIIPATSPSRSLASLIKKENKLIKIEILENGYMILDFSSVIGTRVKINKTFSKRLAKWITSIYESRQNK